MIEQNRGVLLNMLGSLAAAEARYASSLSAFERAQDEEAVSWVLNNIGMLYDGPRWRLCLQTSQRGDDQSVLFVTDIDLSG